MTDLPTPTKPEKASLDELMLAMDVVDTLRHDERLVERELSTRYSDEALIARLREIYQGQGIQVSDETLAAGVQALKEKRFSYEGAKPGLARSLALAWIDRARIGKILLVVVGLIAGGALANYLLFVEPQQRAQQALLQEISQTLPKALEQNYDEILKEAKVDDARQYAAQLLSDGKSALARNDTQAARKVNADMTALLNDLRMEFTLKIVNRSGEASGVWRKPEINAGARNDYLIVEAVTPDGRVLPRPILNEETGVTSTVSKWGIRVSRDVYQKVQSDKRDDGIIERNIVGRKQRGFLNVDYLMPILGGSITKW